MKRSVKQFWCDERGGEMPEYAVVVGLIIVVGAAVFVTIGEHVNAIFEALARLLGGAVDGLPE